MVGTSDYERKFGDSPPFVKSNSSALAAGAWLNISYDNGSADFPSAAKYGPMNSLNIKHGEPGKNSSIKVYVNGDYSTLFSFLSAGQTRGYPKEFIRGGIRSVHIYNAGTDTITADHLEIIAQKIGIEQPDLIRQAHKQVFETKKGGVY